MKNAAQTIDISEDINEIEIRERLDELDVYQPDDWTDGDRVHVNETFTEFTSAGRNSWTTSSPLVAVA